MYREVQPADAGEIVSKSLGKKPVKRLECRPAPVLCPPEEDRPGEFRRDRPRAASRNTSRAEGYSGLMDALTSMTPAEVTATITKSGLARRGRARASRTGLKWSMVAKATSAPEIRDLQRRRRRPPASFSGSRGPRKRPHRVLEGMAIAATPWARTKVTCTSGPNTRWPSAPEAGDPPGRAHGPAGQQHLRHYLQLQRRHRPGRGLAFVCGAGDGTGSPPIEGKRGQPKPRPPYPRGAACGAARRSINNVENLLR